MAQEHALNTDESAGVREDADELYPAVEALEADPGNLSAWMRVAIGLCDDPDTGQADGAAGRQALDSLAAAFGEAGHLPLAIIACLRLSERGEERQAWARLTVLGNAYGKTSTRVDPAIRPRPMQPPKLGAGTAGDLQKAPGPVLRARAVAALRKAAAHAISVQQMNAVQSRQLREPLPQVPLFSALLPDAFVKLAQQLTIKELPAGTRILQAGDIGDTLFIIARGTVRIEARDGTALSTLRGGHFFGEMALLNTSPRLASAIAETKVLLLSARRDDLEQLSARDESIAQVLAEYARRRLLLDVMLTSELFRGLDHKARDLLMSRVTSRRYEAGEVLIADGQPGSELLVVLAGRAEVARRQAPGSSVLLPVATLGLGDVIGEISLLSGHPTSALVHALERVAVLVLRKEDFEEVLSEYPQVRERLQTLATQRASEATEEQPASRLGPRLIMPELLFEDGPEMGPLL